MKIHFTKEDLEGNYDNPFDCPIYRALTRLGYNTRGVGGWYVSCGQVEISLLNGTSNFSHIKKQKKIINHVPSWKNLWRKYETPYFEIEDKINNFKIK